MTAPPFSKSRLRASGGLSMAFVNVPEPALVEVAGHAGFDLVLLDAEHGPLTLHDVPNLVRAADAARIPALVRVPRPTKELVLRSLDAGSLGILVPQVSCPEEAAAAVMESHYPPSGRRGAAFYTRACRYSLDRGADTIAAAEERVVVGVQIETLAAVSNADSILAVPGIDFAFVGPTDLAVDHGSVDPQDPIVTRAIADLADAGRRAGVPMGIYAGSAAAAREYRALGYHVLAVGILPLLTQACAEHLDALSHPGPGRPRTA